MNTFSTVKGSFAGGMRYVLGDSSQIAADEYVFLRNGRNANGVITPVRGVTATSKPPGLLQGLYGFGDFTVAIVAGLVYYKRVADSSWSKVLNVTLSATAPVVYAVAVPASSVNRERLLITTDNEDAGVRFSLAVPGTPSGIVVSDGLTQPWIIFSDGYARLTAAYKDWTLDGNREYVPIGITHLLWANGKMYGVKNGAVISSVTGRPLDFVVAIKSNGDKELDEITGGAEVTSHRADYSTPTCLLATGMEDGSLLLGTRNNVYLLMPDFDFTLFGEHTFKQRMINDVGVPTHVAGAIIAQDFAFVDYKGPKTITELTTFGKGQREGEKDYGFTAPITDLFESVQQSVVAVTNFEGYTYFLCTTELGQVILTWNIVTQRWISIDYYAGATDLKYFATVRSGTDSALYVGGDSEIHQCFTGALETCSLYTNDLVRVIGTDGQPEVKQDLRMAYVHILFSAAYENGSVSVTPFAGQQGGTTVTQTVKATTVAQPVIPFARAFVASCPRLSISTPQAPSNWKVGALVSWNFFGELSYVGLEATIQKGVTSYGQQGFNV